MTLLARAALMVVLTLFCAEHARAQGAGRASDCREHPLLARLPGSTLEDCRIRTFDEFDFVVGAPTDGGTPTLQRHRGSVHESSHRHPKRVAADVVEAQRAALEKQGFTRVFEGAPTPFTRVLTMRREKPTETWVQLSAETLNEGEYSESQLTVLEAGELPRRLQEPAARAPKGVKDAAGCRDLPLVGRLPGARIEACGQRRDVESTAVASRLADAGTVRGDFTSVTYVEAPRTSGFEVAQSYEDALSRAGWEIVDRADGGAQYVLLARKNVEGQDTWLTVSAESFNDDAWIRTVVSSFVPRAPERSP